jgi:hypothetical protein
MAALIGLRAAITAAMVVLTLIIAGCRTSETTAVASQSQKIEPPAPTQEHPPIEQKHEPPARATDPPTRQGMRLIPMTTFFAGVEPRSDDVQPGHETQAGPFYIDEVEVSVQQDRTCIQGQACPEPSENGRGCNLKRKGRDRHPMNCVDWYSAERFCRTQNKRLPAADEWQLAARGTDRRIYPWGEAAPSGQLCCRSNGEAKRSGTCEVGTHLRGDSPYGVHDRQATWPSGPPRKQRWVLAQPMKSTEVVTWWMTWRRRKGARYGSTCRHHMRPRMRHRMSVSYASPIPLDALWQNRSILGATTACASAPDEHERRYGVGVELVDRVHCLPRRIGPRTGSAWLGRRGRLWYGPAEASLHRVFSKLLALALVVLSLIVALPLGGFSYGVEHCQDCRVSDRVFMGSVTAVLTVLSGGFPSWDNDAHGAPRANAWPQVLAVAVVIFCVSFTLVRVSAPRAKRAGES